MKKKQRTPKNEFEIRWAIDQMTRSDLMFDTKDIREQLMAQSYTKSQSNDIIRAARKRTGRYFGKTAYTRRYGLTYA